MTVLSPFDEVIRDFAQAEYLPRIKKLLVYACSQHWESDPDRLARQNLHTLIETLMQIAPTLDQLKTYLDQVTQSLSKPAEYLLIANAIVQSLRKLYVGTGSMPDLNSNPHLYWQVAQALEQDPDHLRMRKLLILLCRNHWELDTNRLLAESLPDLVYELHHLTQSMDNLQAVFNSIVQNTSKPAQYGAIASRIIAACEPLYGSQATSQTELRFPAPGTASSPPSPLSSPHGLQARGSTPPLPPRSTPNAASPEPHRAPVTGINWTALDSASLESGQSSALESSASLADHSSAEAISDAPSAEASSDPESSDSGTDAIPTFSQGELFDLRLEIMKYTVPLLAKQVLFLTLYAPVEHNSDEAVAEMATDAETWASLKNRDLDDLIEGTLKQYPTLSMLEEGLLRSARLSPDQQRSVPVASAIARAVKTLIAKHHPGYLRDRSEAATDNLRNAEQTRQVALPTVSFDQDDLDGLKFLDSLPPQSPQKSPGNHPGNHPSQSLGNNLGNHQNRRPPSSPSSSLTGSTLNQDDTVITG